MPGSDDPPQTGELTQVGALARATGLTVRTLHHYDAIGLLVPDERSSSGRRLYSTRNVSRLYRIVALRRLGLSLEEIAAILDHEPDLAAAIQAHLARVERELEAQTRLQRTLTQMLEQLERHRQPSVEEFIDAIEASMTVERYFTEEQREHLARRRRTLGEDAIRRSERDWAELIQAVRDEQAAGTDPRAPRMAELARRWRNLIRQFTGGDEAIGRSLATMYEQEGPRAASRGMVDPELMAYVAEALSDLGATG